MSKYIPIEKFSHLFESLFVISINLYFNSQIKEII